MKKHWKLLLFISIEFLIVITIVLLTLFAGRKTYTVTFDLNGGTYISGNLVQTVRHGQDAVAPVVTKDGAYLLEWSEPLTQITKDKTIKAVWEYETSFGIQFEFVPNANYCLISGCYENISGDVYIGANYNGLRVMGIKDGAFQNCNRITGIYLLDGLVSIGNNAFSGCTSLKTLEIPSTVEVIGTNILKDCTSLEKLSIPFIGSSFGAEENQYLGYLFGAKNFKYHLTTIPETLAEVTISGKGEIPENAFYNCQSITTLNLSDDITKINKNAFRNCIGLTSVIVPDSVLEIDETAFVDCSSIESLVIGNGVTKIGSAAFANCTSLKTIEIGSGLIELEENSFQNCSSIEKFTVSSENETFISENGLLIKEIEGVKNIYSINLTEYEDTFDEDNDPANDETLFPTLPDRPIFPPIRDDYESLFPIIDPDVKDPDLNFPIIEDDLINEFEKEDKIEEEQE